MTDNYGIKISKDGFDVTTTEEKNLVFTSARDTLKVFLQGSTNVIAAGTVTVAHSLGYVPSFYSFITINGGTYDGYNTPIPSSYPISPTIYFAYATNSNIKFVVEANAFAGNTDSYDIKYVIFINEIA